jgi:type I restriction enzyme S subunit
MVVEKGYNQTEVGVIPEDWDVKFLPQVTRFRGGKAHEQFIAEAGDYVCVNSKFISSDGKVRKHCFRNFCCARLNDILMVMSDLPNGKALAKAFLADADDRYAVNQRVCSLTAYRDCPHYLFYILNRNPYFLKFDDGVSQTHLLNRVFQKCPIPLPPTLAEQEAIAGALSDADAWIESLEQLIAKKRQIKQGAMQELLTGNRRLPGFSGKWETKRLGEFLVSHPQYGINAAAVPYSDKLPAYIRITDITEYGQYAPDPRVCVRASDVTSYFLADGDLVIARTGASVGKSYRYRIADGPLVFAGFLIRIRPNASQLTPRFLEAYLASQKYWNWIRLMSMRSGQPGINGNEYAQLPIELPSIDEQTAIATVLSDMDTEIESLESKLAKAREIKQGMMQELLTGRVRLVN